ncbi:MAG: cache domain-containing protein, partial [Rhodoferax sp.]
MKHPSPYWRRAWLLLAAALLAAGVWVAFNLLHEYDRIERQELDRLSLQAKVIDDNLMRQLAAIKRSLQSIQQALPGWQSSPAGHAQGQRTLANMEAVMSSVRTLLVADAQGTVTFSNREELLGRNFYARDYVQAPLKALNPEVLYVSPPFKSVLNHYLINLTRVLLDDKGQFAGVVSASIDPADINILLNSVRYSDDMQAMLIHGDGKIFISEPVLDQAAAQALSAPDALLRQHLRSHQVTSHFSGSMALTSDQRLVVMRTFSPVALVMDKPLVVVLSRAQKQLFAPWRRNVLTQAGAYLMLVLICLVGLSVWQRQQAQKNMAAKRLKLATEASGVGIWEFDLISKRYQWDNTMFALFGLDPKVVSSRNDDWIKLLTTEDLQRMRDATRATIQQDKAFSMTFQICRPDGQVRFMHNRAALYSDERGVPRRLIGATEDVTQRMHQEAELRVAAAAFESHESMLVTNARMEILRVNPAFSVLFGYTSDE